MARARRCWVSLLIAGCALALVPAAGAQQEAERELVEKYSPIVMLREQLDPPCDKSEEQYLPTTVGAVLGNLRVTLVPPSGSGRRPKRAPTAADIAGLGTNWHLDLPGNAVQPGCTFARDFAGLRRSRRTPALTYAHIARQRGRSGLALQYWFFYYFNQFNDVHESDWEGMQILFDSTSASGALDEDPTEVGLFQHEGGERAEWSDDKVEKRGTHPVVYPAAGSHATFYESSIFLENGRAGSGVGCDDTSEPLRMARPKPELVPTRPAAGSRYQWLTYLGRWGQRAPGYNNGPQGPSTKTQWLKPFDKQDEMLRASVQLPSGAVVGPTVTSAFCGVMAELSLFVNLAIDSPLGAIALGLGLIALVVVPASLTRWRPAEVMPLRRPRRTGQLLRAGGRIYRRHWRVLVLLGLTSLVIVAVFEGLRVLLVQVLGEDSVALFGTSHASQGLYGSIVAVGSQVGVAIVTAAIVTYMRELERGRTLSALRSYRLMAPRFWRAVGVHLLARYLALLLALTVIGIPYAIKKYVDWQLVQQEVLFEDRSLRDALRASSRTVRGHWWHTAATVAVLLLLGLVAGPALGIVLVFTPLPPGAVNLFGSVVYALVIPFLAVSVTLLYLDLSARQRAAA